MSSEARQLVPPYAVRRRSSSKDLLLTAGCTRLLGSSSVCFGPLIEDLYSGGKRPHCGGGAVLWRRGSLEWFIGVANQPTSNKEHYVPAVLTCLTEGQRQALCHFGLKGPNSYCPIRAVSFIRNGANI